MKDNADNQMEEVVSRIMDHDMWPNLEMPENLEMLNEMADEAFSTGSLSGMLSAVLMYHQLIEAMCLHLMEDCHFLIQLSVFPATIRFSVAKNKMLGTYVSELKDTVSFHKKDEFLEKVSAFNLIRNDAIHKMRKSNLEELSEKLRKAKDIFDEVFELYDEIQDDFRVVFHSFRKDVFLDEYGSDEEVI